MMQHCDQTCGHCARQWWTWLKSREHQMAMARKGESTSFSQAALTSVHAPRALEPCTCVHPVDSTRTYQGRTVTVVFNVGYVGLDGHHWVTVREVGERADGLGAYDPMHVPCGMLGKATE